MCVCLKDVYKRQVLELLNTKNWKLGGENSGHILTLDKHTSGDAIIAALQVLQALVEGGKTLAQMREKLVLYPQVLINVTTKQKLDLNHASIQQAVKPVSYTHLSIRIAAAWRGIK